MHKTTYSRGGAQVGYLVAPISILLILIIHLKYGWIGPAFVLDFFAIGLVTMSVIDCLHYIIPDEIHYLLLPLGVTYNFLIQVSPAQMMGGFVLGASVGLAVHKGYRWLKKKEGLGLGDVKFLAVAGLWLGMQPLVPFLFCSAVVGILFGLLWQISGKGHVFPFGPALATALFLSVVFPQISDRLLIIL